MNTTTNNIAIKFRDESSSELRRVRTAATFGAVRQAAEELFGAQQLRLSYVDAEGDRVTFSSDAELADALAQLSANGTLSVTVAKATTAEKTEVVVKANPWLELPTWARRRIAEKHGVSSDAIDDPATFDKLPAHAQECVRQRVLKHAKPAAVKVTATASEDEAMWSVLPHWFKAKMATKYGVVGSPVADFATFRALPADTQARIRERHAKDKAKQQQQQQQPAAPVPPTATATEESDRAMWAALPVWVHFKIASKSARHGAALPADVHDFAAFQALPEHVKDKIRHKADKFSHPRPFPFHNHQQGPFMHAGPFAHPHPHPHHFGPRGGCWRRPPMTAFQPQPAPAGTMAGPF